MQVPHYTATERSSLVMGSVMKFLDDMNNIQLNMVASFLRCISKAKKAKKIN